MILVIGGTTEGRELAALLKEQGFQCVLSVSSALGRDFATDCLDLISGELNYEQLAILIDKGGFRIILDATHPYAEQIKLTAQRVAKEKGVTYLRYQRPAAILPEGSNLFRAIDYSSGLKILEQSSGGILLTVGVRKLHLFQSLWAEQRRPVWVKVLPAPESLDICVKLGLRPEQIIAFYGSGSKEQLSIILQQTGVEWLVAKDSGNIGGTDLKVAAALEMGRRVLVIDRPSMIADYVFDNYQAILDWLAIENRVKRGMRQEC